LAVHAKHFFNLFSWNGNWPLRLDFGSLFAVGGESYAQGKDTTITRDLPHSISAVPTTLMNISVCCLAPGHNVADGDNTLWYFGLY
jgi:hypothetical protein